jgi:Uma2 family endonuclease
MDDDEFFEFCTKNPELRIERDATGEIIIMPPCGYDTEDRNVEIVRQLGHSGRTRERHGLWHCVFSS